MVWGCMGWNGVGKLIKMQGKMNAKQYGEVLEEGVVESLKHWRWLRMGITFSRTMIQNTPPKGNLMVF